MCCLFGHHVDVGPTLVVGTTLQQGQIDGSEPLTHFLEGGRVTRIGTEIDLLAVRLHHPRAPQGAEAIGHATAREMARWGQGQLHRSQVHALPPIAFGDSARRNTPQLQVRTYTQWRHETLVLQLQHGLVVQVIVMVVRQQHHVHRRQQVHAHVLGVVEALRASEREGGCPLAEHGIDQEGGSAHLDQQGGMPEPGYGERAIRHRLPGREVHRHCGQRVLWFACITAA